MSNYYGTSRIDAMQDSISATTWDDDIAAMRQIVADMTALQVGEYGSFTVRGADGDALYTGGQMGGGVRK